MDREKDINHVAAWFSLSNMKVIDFSIKPLLKEKSCSIAESSNFDEVGKTILTQMNYRRDVSTCPL